MWNSEEVEYFSMPNSPILLEVWPIYILYNWNPSWLAIIGLYVPIWVSENLWFTVIELN